jgi:HEAT repeat protein
MKARAWVGPLLFAAALVPGASALVAALSERPSFADDEGESQDEAPNEGIRARRKILRDIPNDAAVLINVTYRDLPSSPDIVNLGKRSTKALERCLADNVEENARARCAIVLEALADRRALPTLQHALEDWDETVRFRVVKALGAMPDASSVEPLVSLFKRKDEQGRVREQIVKTLGAISDQRVVKLLRAELARKPGKGGEGEEAEPQQDLRTEAFDALWMQRHLMNRDTLIDDVKKALKSDNQSLVLSATLASAELRSPKLTAALVPLMESGNLEIANKAIYALGRIGDKTATKALLDRLPQVRESRMLNNIAFALERLDKKAFYAEIAKTVEHKQAVIRLNSAFVLGDVSHKEGLPLLEKSLGDASDFVRTSAVAAIGKLALDGADREHALKALEPLASDKNLSLREEAIYALHALTPGGRADLVHDRMFKLPVRKYETQVHRAALALSAIDDGRVRDYLLTCLLSHGCPVEKTGRYFVRHPSEGASGRMLLTWTRGNHWLTDTLAQLRPAGAAPLAMAALHDSWTSPEQSESVSAIELLGGLGEATAMPLLQQRAGTDRTWPRILSLVAAGRLGDTAAGDKLMNEMDNLAAESLPELTFAMSSIAEEPFRQKLEPLLEKKQGAAEPQLALCAAAIRLAWYPEKAIFRFLDALGSTSGFERELAARYLAHNKDRRVTWVMRRALSREGRRDVADRLRGLLDERT